MWWLDEDLYRQNRGNRGLNQLRYVTHVAPPPIAHPSVPRPAGPRPGRHRAEHRNARIPAPIRIAPLTDAQREANRTLLESAAPNEVEIQSLRANITELEESLRKNSAAFQTRESELLSDYESQLEELNDQLSTAKSELRATSEALHRNAELHAVANANVDALERLLAEQQDVSTHALSLCQETEIENSRLRETVVDVEQKLQGQTGDLQDLRSRLATCEHEFAQKISETIHLHQSECDHLRSVATLADSRAAGRNAVIADHETQIKQLTAQIVELELQGKSGLENLRDDAKKREDELERALLQAEEKQRHSASELELALQQIADLQSQQSALEEASEQAAQKCVDIQEAFDERERAHARAIQGFNHKLLESEKLVIEMRQQQADHAEAMLELDRCQNDAWNEVFQGQYRQLAIEEDAKTKLAALQHGFDQWKAEAEWEKNNVHNELQQLGASLDRQRNETLVHKTHAAALTDKIDEQQRIIDELKNVNSQSLATISQLQSDAQGLANVSSEEVEQLRVSLQREQEAVLEKEKQAQEIEQQLKLKCSDLEIRLSKMNEDVQIQSEQKQIEIGQLQGLLERRESEILQLGDNADQKKSNEDQNIEKIRKLADERERLVQIQNSQAETLQNRTDELLLELDDEKEKRRIAENECRRLSLERSERITFLSRQREELLAEVSRLKQMSNHIRLSSVSLKDEGAVLRDTLISLEKSLEDTQAKLNKKTADFERLRGDYKRGREKGKNAVKTYATNLAQARSQIEKLSAKNVWAQRELERLKAKANQRADIEVSQDVEFAITQRDRTIASLEQQAILTQKRLQTEAAARRKAESLVKRASETSSPAHPAQSAWSSLDADEQNQRLSKQLAALRNISLLERQRAAGEIGRLKKEITLLRDQKDEQKGDLDENQAA